jgi:hypothetical protein
MHAACYAIREFDIHNRIFGDHSDPCRVYPKVNHHVLFLFKIDK